MEKELCQKENVETLWLFPPKSYWGQKVSLIQGMDDAIVHCGKMEQKKKEKIWRKKKVFITVIFSDGAVSTLGWKTCGILSLLTQLPT